MQGGNLIGSGAVNPEEAKSSRLRAVSHMLKDQRESTEPASQATELLDSVGYRGFAPRRYKGEVNIRRLD